MTRIFLILSIFSFPLFSIEATISKETKKRLQSEAKDLGNKSMKKAFSSLESYNSVDDLLPKEDKGKEFDSGNSKEDVLNGNTGTNSVMKFLEENPATDAYLSENESLFSEYEHEIEGFEEVCHESATPIEFPVTRTLSYQPKQETERVVIRKCLGHEETTKVDFGKGKSKAKKRKSELERDTNIQWFEVECKEWGSHHHDLVISKWRHIENSSSCDNLEEIIEYHETGLWKITDEKWVYSNTSLEEIAKHENSTLLSKSCLDDVPRMINGTKMCRCWVEQFLFRYTPKKVCGCDFLKSQFCRLKKSDCLKQGPFGCDLWKRTFTCHKKLNKKQKYEIDPNDLGIEDLIWEVEYEPNKNLADVVTKLEVFKEMDRDLENSTTLDFKNFEFFSGKKLRCFVNFMEDLVYDCCDKMGGLAVDGLISKCDADELALSDLRNRGQCRFIGEKENYTLGLKVSKKNVYCCFPSKLARVFIEEAKEQLGLDWGTAKNPECGGLTQAQIQQVDFNKLNLSEAFESHSEEYKERLNRLQQKIQDEMKVKEKENV